MLVAEAEVLILGRSELELTVVVMAIKMGHLAHLRLEQQILAAVAEVAHNKVAQQVALA